MDKQLRTILADLYKIDPELKKHSAMVEKIVKELIDQKPDTKFDATFKQELYNSLLRRIEREKPIGASKVSFGMPKFVWYFGASVAVIVIAAVGVIKFLPSQDAIISDSNIFGNKIAVKTVDNNAFGKLSADIASDPAQFAGLGGGGIGAANLESEGKDRAISSMPYIPKRYKYIYEGEEFTLEDLELPVYLYRNNKSKVAASTVLSNFDFDQIDLNSFENTNVSNLTFMEDREYGYYININLDENAIYINQNYDTWPQPASECRDEACFRSIELKLSDIPDSDTIISLANKFLSDHKISLANYGQGIVDDTWRRYAERNDESLMYVPDTISVTYPLVVDGSEVYNSAGRPSGLVVGVNVRYNKVSHVGTLKSYSFDKSNYEAEMNADRILEIAAQGGINNNWFRYDNIDINEIELGLGTPERILLQHYQYTDGETKELIVPALKFPIINIPDGEVIYNDSIVIPLIKDLLEDGTDSVYPMPLLEAGANSGDVEILEIEEASQIKSEEVIR